MATPVNTNLLPMPKLFSYVVDHDHGFAPNPLGGMCSLAKCKFGWNKRNIVELAEVGDWVAGTGGANTKKCSGNGTLLYAMRVDQKLPLAGYFDLYGDRIDAKKDCAVTGRYAFISRHFFYFGRNAIDIDEIPQHNLVHRFEKKGPGFRRDFPEDFVSSFATWIEKTFKKGRHGAPCQPFASVSPKGCPAKVKRKRVC